MQAWVGQKQKQNIKKVYPRAMIASGRQWILTISTKNWKENKIEEWRKSQDCFSVIHPCVVFYVSTVDLRKVNKVWLSNDKVYVSV